MSFTVVKSNLFEKYPTPKQLLCGLSDRPDATGLVKDRFFVFDNYHLTCHGRTICIRYISKSFHVCFRGFLPEHYLPKSMGDMSRHDNSWSTYSIRSDFESALDDFIYLGRNLLRFSFHLYPVIHDNIERLS